jgi:hypothetical protein
VEPLPFFDWWFLLLLGVFANDSTALLKVISGSFVRARDVPFFLMESLIVLD